MIDKQVTLENMTVPRLQSTNLIGFREPEIPSVSVVRGFFIDGNYLCNHNSHISLVSHWIVVSNKLWLQISTVALFNIYFVLHFSDVWKVNMELAEGEKSDKNANIAHRHNTLTVSVIGS